MLKQLGSSSIKLFPIGLGTGFTQEEYKNPKQLISIIQNGIEMGLQLIDTAESYGDGLSEALIGKALVGNRSKVIIATKFSPEHSSSTQLINSCNSSLKRLSTDYIDILQFHWPNPQISLEDTLKGIQMLIKSGKIRFVGAGNSSKKELGFLKKELGNKLVSFQSEFNLYEQFPRNSGLINYCQNNQLTFISYSPLDQGRVENFTKKQYEALLKLQQKYNANLNQIILNWQISYHPIIPIPKTTNLKHLLENINSVNFSLEKKEVQFLTETFNPVTHFIPVQNILIAAKGERERSGYQDIQTALNNPLKLVPGPIELAVSLDQSDFKPIRLISSKQKNKYMLINGRVRYWAWIIAFGYLKPIPAYIRTTTLKQPQT